MHEALLGSMVGTSVVVLALIFIIRTDEPKNVTTRNFDDYIFKWLESRTKCQIDLSHASLEAHIELEMRQLARAMGYERPPTTNDTWVKIKGKKK